MAKHCEGAIEHDRGSAGSSPSSAARPRIARSRASYWRAGVLFAVYVAVAIHVVHWRATGSTLSPVEPSESIQLAKRGVVNAGAIFFALTIFSTLLFGRWFCGWACHIVALQDLCRWMLGKLHFRPRAIQLGVLGVVPWLVFTYMFLAPFVQRALHGDDLLRSSMQVTTDAFWATFPGWLMSIATFAICGFVIVAFLGAKGFCTYGCPYGAIFGVVDQLAPVRIRVTDACEQCGHCTAVCTSNVRVHLEVRDFGMVVDAGCMKCLDCVSVCPKDALYVGAGVPAMFAKARRALPAATVASGERLARLVLLAGFVFATTAVLLLHNDDFDWPLALILSGVSFAVAVAFRGKARRAADSTIAEETALAGVFLATLFALRNFAPFGLDDGLPLLCSLGASAIIAYLFLAVARTTYRSSTALQKLALRVEGRMTRAGYVAAIALVAMLSFVAYGATWQFERREQRATAAAQNAQAVDEYQRGVERAANGDTDAAIARFSKAVELAPDFVEARENLAGMLCQAGRFGEGVEHYLIALRSNPNDADTHALLGQAYLGLEDSTRAEEQFEAALRLQSDHRAAHLGLAFVLSQRGDEAGARRHVEAAERIPEQH